MKKDHVTTEFNSLVAQSKKYFDVDVIGSYILYCKKLIPLQMVGDIDMAVPKEVQGRFEAFLVDNGYKKEERKEYGYRSSQFTLEPTGFFKKDSELDIHLIVKPPDFKVLSANDILVEKVKRDTEKDSLVVIEALKNKIKTK